VNSNPVMDTTSQTDWPAIIEIEEGALTGLHARLTSSAWSEGLLDVAYRTVDSPVGPLLLASTAEGLLRVAFAAEDHERVLADLAVRVSPRILWAPRRLDQAANQLEEYFGQRRTVFDLPLDLSLTGGFRHEVLLELAQIPYGQTKSYTEVATAAGRPRAVRAVGSACATNPLPIIVPCHRVLRSTGALGGYLGGLAAKVALLQLEKDRVEPTRLPDSEFTM